MSSNKFTFVLCEAVCLLSLVLASSCGSDTANREQAPQPSAPVAVSVSAVSDVTWPETFEAPGTVRARSVAKISARTVGLVREVRVKEGDRIPSGTLMATLEAKELQSSQQRTQAAVDEARAAIPEADSAIAQAQTQLDLAQLTLRRMRELLDKRSVAQSEYDQAAAQAKVAESAKAMAEARRRQLDDRIRQAERAVETNATQLEYLEIHAPFSGRVTARIAEPGILASPGVPLFEMESDDGFRLEVRVPEARLGGIRAGQGVDVSLEGRDATIRTRVDEVVPEIDAASGSFIAKIALPTIPEIRSGRFGRATFATGTRKVLAIPAGAVGEQGQLRTVFVVDSGVARMRFVRTGAERDGMIEILSGLTAGESVVNSPPPGFSDGQPVEVRP